ncbi:basic proline-rich protein-like [Vulpes lagopus]|uniref:basic proline-rich protein-like n=1 Tax=Vulpes lagopus TaxID=494514 RepID=UPI001BCA3C2F|nr:basic proline-rich protein-like [Vulpes lagopus]
MGLRVTPGARAGHGPPSAPRPPQPLRDTRPSAPACPGPAGAAGAARSGVLGVLLPGGPRSDARRDPERGRDRGFPGGRRACRRRRRQRVRRAGLGPAGGTDGAPRPDLETFLPRGRSAGDREPRRPRDPGPSAPPDRRRLPLRGRRGSRLFPSLPLPPPQRSSWRTKSCIEELTAAQNPSPRPAPLGEPAERSSGPGLDPRVSDAAAPPATRLPPPATRQPPARTAPGPGTRLPRHVPPHPPERPEEKRR